MYERQIEEIEKMFKATVKSKHVSDNILNDEDIKIATEINLPEQSKSNVKLKDSSD